MARQILQALAQGAASWRAARLRRAGNGVPAQRLVFRRLIRAMSATAYGREQGMTAQLSRSEFCRQVPLAPYEALHPFVERMKRGEPDVLWPGHCRHYAVSSGTTAGRTKYLPVTREMSAHFSQAGLDSLLFLVRRQGHARVFGGRQLFLGGATDLTPLPAPYDTRAVSGDLSGITALEMPRWAARLLYEPGLEIARTADWPRKIAAIVERCYGRDIRLVAGIPTWTLILFEALRERALREGRRFETVRDVWPDLECLVHGGVPLAPFAAELRRWLGPGVTFHEVYPASEGFFAAQDEEPEAGLRLLADRGIYYEFLPMDRFDEDRIASLGEEAVPLEGVRPGVNYALVLTTPAGLCRYVIGDVVRFVSTDVPRLVYAGRTKLQLSAFGEHVIEYELTQALAAVCSRRGWSAGSFHVAPLWEDAPGGGKRGRHEWWLELRGADAARVAALGAETAAVAAELDRELARLNEDYEAKRAGLGLEPPALRLVPEGTFEVWMRRAGKWGGQNKMPRCRSDRLVADALAAVAADPR